MLFLSLNLNWSPVFVMSLKNALSSKKPIFEC
uniref:Uncharacterized protein n=1 Tax=Anguilla anguilla TaxID=7936 RepID=A0A0E9P9X8_ANGAN